MYKCIEEECIFFHRSEYKDWIGSCMIDTEHKLIPLNKDVDCAIAKEKHLKDARAFMIQPLIH